ncbi:scavenger receptor class B member 1-like [Pectinophora gossypiella]|uniref:scavenger receptor class B member 1-like n=1 Tax=Pectinophora gossypiella TaxID=13191 RepID=UPI00214E0C04|nr:scavenger receptor class B member 1-like [Pectinophora gossypiella]XP_049883793.1 scavenger receptor class B member 1-like [Pectinophora gossypiella]XP_049883795.1 scavenger receptor class B member 1-like [Pectinophora gossypiella]XP_049883796.1 scavenger receptor class B member 1-like [Pectinophora gossypiella]XP_049883797.1 scavenger receptor class B member 1-like [Pectinophora gossypiella]
MMASSESNSASESDTADTQTTASDSLNSLIASTSDKAECADVQCSLASQCAMSCEDGELKMEQRKSVCCNAVAQCVWGCLLLVVSIGGFLFTPLDVMLKEKLNMRPGFPPFEWWADPPDEVKLRVYVFNVTNHERFMKGLDSKMHISEIGPIVYLEKLLHSNIRFNDNSTMSYTAKRFPIFLPDENTVDLNSTIIVPNLAVLGMASFLYDANYIVRTGFRFLVNSHGSDLFLKKTIYEYLWDYKEPVLDTSKHLVPGMVPVNNMGMLARIYSDFTDEVTVKIGQQWGHSQFFHIDRFRGQPQLPGYDPDRCPDRIFGSTEGVMYHQHLTKEDILMYWRKTVCKSMPLYFDSEMMLDSVPVYRYNLSEIAFERVKNGTDCYDTVPGLPSGLSDGSKCYFDFPMVISYPHFYTGSPPKDMYVTGLVPDREKHSSHVIVEPMTGIPFQSVARMQSNLRVNDMSGFAGEYTRFSNLVVPLFWAEYNQEGLPLHISWTIYFMIVILPPLSSVMLTFTLLLGCYFITKQIYIHKLRNDSLDSILHFKSKNVNTLAKNKIFLYEKEAFIKMPS